MSGSLPYRTEFADWYSHQENMTYDRLPTTDVSDKTARYVMAIPVTFLIHESDAPLPFDAQILLGRRYAADMDIDIDIAMGRFQSDRLTKRGLDRLTGRFGRSSTESFNNPLPTPRHYKGSRPRLIWRQLFGKSRLIRLREHATPIHNTLRISNRRTVPRSTVHEHHTTYELRRFTFWHL